MYRILRLILIVPITLCLFFLPAVRQVPTGLANSCSTRYAGITTAYAAPLGKAATINGGGHGMLSDPDGNTFLVQYAIVGNVAEDGTANGHINFVFQGEMANYWGAVPGVVDTFHVFGKATEGSVAQDGTVTIKGTVTEQNFDTGSGKILVIEGDPFVIVAGPSVGENTFTLQYCALPVWQITVESGSLQIH